jgi:hypothetical protein
VKLAKYNRMVRRFPALWAIVIALGAATACHRSSPEAGIRQGVIDYLSMRSNLNVSGMNVDVTSLVVRQNEADAVVSFTAKGANPGQPMSMRYTLERKGDRWVVKDKVEAGGSPHGGAAPPSGGQLSPGHPSVDSANPK